MFAFSLLQYWKLVSSYCQKVETGIIYRCNAIDDFAKNNTGFTKDAFSTGHTKPEQSTSFWEVWRVLERALRSKTRISMGHCTIQRIPETHVQKSWTQVQQQLREKTRNHLVGGTKQTNQFQLSTKQACPGSQSVLIGYKRLWENKHSSIAFHFID